MSGSANVLDKYISRIPEPTKRAASEEAGACDDLRAFGLLRGLHDRSVMLELRLKNGNTTAFNYNHLVKASFDPSEGITLHFGGQLVKIIGTNLGAEVRPNLKLFQAIIRHRVPWLQEADQHDSLGAAGNSLIIDHIEIPE